MKRALLIPLVALGLGASWSSGARADDQVTVTPDAAQVTASSPTGYTITLSGDTPASEIRFLLPSHGQPCGYPDTLGEPSVGGDADTNWLVTDAQGGIQVGRWITWTGDFRSNTTIHISVISAPLGGCFYAGASATAQTPVVGLKKGAQVFNAQDPTFGTSGTTQYASASARDFTLTWKMWNGSDQRITVIAERLGTRTGWGVTGWTYGSAPVVTQDGAIYTWREAIVIPAHDQIRETVSMTRPCGGAGKSLRLRITRSDGLTAGTGDGVPIPLAAC